MNKICTSIEQSQKLIDLGIDISTADMRYGYIAPYDFSDRMYEGGYDPIPYHKDFFIKNPMFSTEEYDGELYAWSLSALLNIIPKRIKDFNVLRIDIAEKDFSMWYDEIGYGVNTELPDITMECPVDVAFEMICWLKENKKI